MWCKTDLDDDSCHCCFHSVIIITTCCIFYVNKPLWAFNSNRELHPLTFPMPPQFSPKVQQKRKNTNKYKGSNVNASECAPTHDGKDINHSGIASLLFNTFFLNQSSGRDGRKGHFNHRELSPLPPKRAHDSHRAPLMDLDHSFHIPNKTTQRQDTLRDDM